MLPKKIRKTNKKLMKQYHETNCVACGRFGSDPAHTKTRGSGADDVDENLMSLCRKCHTRQGAIGWRKFCDSHPSVEKELIRKGWKLELIFGVWKLIRS